MKNRDYVHVMVNNGQREYLIDGTCGLVDGATYQCGDAALEVLVGMRIFRSDSVRYFSGGGTINITVVGGE